MRGGGEKRKSNRQVDVQSKGGKEDREKQKLAFHLVTAATQRERGGIAKLRERNS